MSFDVPEGWKRVRLGDIADRRTQSFDPLANGARRYVSLEHITPNRRTINNFGDSSDTKSTKTVFERSDVLFGRLRPYLKKVALPQKAGVCSTDILALRPKKSVDSEFLYAVMADDWTIQFAVNNSRGTRMPRTSWKALSKFPVLLPPLPEQKKIAAILSSVDEAIEATEAVIEQTRQVKKGLLQELLTRGIGHTEFKKTAIGEIPKSWGVVRCEQLTTRISVGIVVRPTQYYTDSGVRCFRSANVREGYISDENWVYISEESNEKLSKSRLEVGDVLVVRTGYPGTSCVVTEEYGGTNCVDILFARPKRDKVLPEYLSAFINSDLGKTQVLNAQTGLAQQHFNVRELKKMLVSLPPLNEQVEIITVLEGIQNEEFANEQTLASLQKLKKGLLQDLLTGTVRVKGAGVSTLVEAGV